MKLNEQTAKLICDLEPLVGRECYNPNSYNGWTGEEGCAFRYPICVRANPKDKELSSTKQKVASIAKPTPDVVKTMKYRFGSNHLFVGLAICSILNALEQRYGLNFAELEKNRLSKKKKTNAIIAE